MRKSWQFINLDVSMNKWMTLSSSTGISWSHFLRFSSQWKHCVKSLLYHQQQHCCLMAATIIIKQFLDFSGNLSSGVQKLKCSRWLQQLQQPKNAHLTGCKFWGRTCRAAFSIGFPGCAIFFPSLEESVAGRRTENWQIRKVSRSCLGLITCGDN